ncbi:hypothetical protein JL720_16032 [Aureococcus anophagefferens]|nr:hypothetical protein JL720_16032 [Aureococcus anophagefferens]
MGSMDDENVFLRDVTAGEQEYARSLLRGARVLYLAKVTKVEDRKLSVDGAGREHDAAPMERILVLGAYRLFSIKRRMTGLACIRQGHAQDLERVAHAERRPGRAPDRIPAGLRGPRRLPDDRALGDADDVDAGPEPLGALAAPGAERRRPSPRGTSSSGSRRRRVWTRATRRRSTSRSTRGCATT